MHDRLVFGDGWIDAELPNDARVVGPGITLPLPPTEDLAGTARDALEHPVDTPPLEEMSRGARRVVVAFDDPTVPCYAPLWATAMPLVLDALSRAGVEEGSITLLCANALHRKFTHDELARILEAVGPPDPLGRLPPRFRSPPRAAPPVRGPAPSDRRRAACPCRRCLRPSGRSCHFLRGELRVDDLAIGLVADEELGVRTDRDDPAGVHDQDPVRRS